MGFWGFGACLLIGRMSFEPDSAVIVQNHSVQDSQCNISLHCCLKTPPLLV